MLKIAALALLVAAAPVQAASFHCHATPESKQCALDGCSESGNYMDISVQNGTLSFCEGEDCAEGKILMRREHGPVLFVFAHLTTNAELKTRFPLSIMADRAKRIVHVSSGDDQRLIQCEAE